MVEVKPKNAAAAGRPAPWLSVGEVAKRSGVAVSTLHFYEAKGLIAAARSSGNQRRYSRDVLRRIAIVRVAQRLGLPLSEIAELCAAIPPGTTPSPAAIREMATTWRIALQARIDGLMRLRDHLDGCIGCGCLSQASCPLRNPDDRLASTGSGPVLLLGAHPEPASDDERNPVSER